MIYLIKKTIVMGVIKACCCCTLKTGSITSGIYSLCSSLVYILLVVMQYIVGGKVKLSFDHEFLVYSTFVLYGFLAAASVLLIVSVYKYQYQGLCPWLMFSVLAIIQGIGFNIWVVVTNVKTTEHLPLLDLLIIVCHTVNTVIMLLCFLCVMSHFQHLVKVKKKNKHKKKHRPMIMVICPSPEEAVPDDITCVCPSIGHNPVDTMEKPPPYTTDDTKPETDV